MVSDDKLNLDVAEKQGTAAWGLPTNADAVAIRRTRILPPRICQPSQMTVMWHSEGIQLEC
ncbi:hypothetical protein KP509_31G007600 [Ceratopteris richardii]|uniref:Uncharacterized protein n=1 Tax=Ceratopteris richardii TaxID=49495 RepID=A0A8T2QVW0_CERRI|nr:hypothetical protein KP509_31G007600 [Ceratopteris richardii]